MARTFNQQMAFQAWRTNDLRRCAEKGLNREWHIKTATASPAAVKSLGFHVFDTTRSAAL